jgi:hypothetical protein
MMYRQGDVLVIRSEHVPIGAVPVPREDGKVVLAAGERTGHAHTIAESHAELFAEPSEDVTDRFLRVVGQPAVLRHEEHAPITLPPGQYVVRRQREYTREDAIRVQD